ncbi:unnamed protein product (macronuclear) [Paramecium tetraurelia]|uniref:Transmembrane protein n=1 Tax=Paramecium tetraurelia TaxID=5888 RepID=A0EEJ4_PARTE|nr:uncharacterized protein GSPATT00026057001 [Paramecium tetraurelia]CAK93726.1 unnamed protein product [Paramecium tetraurelia]|eukprot:XP_001461108.1 hypothetical protein (macronuclear) [Paramecium tetraurelia strain d4-2]
MSQYQFFQNFRQIEKQYHQRFRKSYRKQIYILNIAFIYYSTNQSSSKTSYQNYPIRIKIVQQTKKEQAYTLQEYANNHYFLSIILWFSIFLSLVITFPKIKGRINCPKGLAANTIPMIFSESSQIYTRKLKFNHYNLFTVTNYGQNGTMIDIARLRTKSHVNRKCPIKLNKNIWLDKESSNNFIKVQINKDIKEYIACKLIYLIMKVALINNVTFNINNIHKNIMALFISH